MGSAGEEGQRCVVNIEIVTRRMQPSSACSTAKAISHLSERLTPEQAYAAVDAGLIRTEPTRKQMEEDRLEFDMDRGRWVGFG